MEKSVGSHHDSHCSISVAIVTWNSRKWITACLESLLKQSLPADEILVIDNGSEDGIQEDIERFESSRLKLTALKKNVGFAAGHNVGIRETSGEFHLMLNPDLKLDPGYLERLMKVFGNNPRVGMATGKILRIGQVGKRGRPIIDSVGVGVGLSRAMFDIGEDEEDVGQYERDASRNAVSGCCAMFRRKALCEVGAEGMYFDERLFMYREDVDLCWRMFRAGWDGAYVHDATACHQRHGTWSSDSSSRFRVLNLRNRYMVLANNDSAKSFFLHLPFILIYEGLLFLRVFRHPSLFRGYLDGFRFFFKDRKSGPLASFRSLRRPGFFVSDFRYFFKKFLGA